MGSVSEAPPEPHRRDSYNGLKLASDSIDRVDEPDFVLGVGPATRVLAKLTIRRPVRSALDLGTGLGVQALLTARHAERVVGVEINPRALTFAVLNARLNEVDNVEWRLGSWLEPVAGEQFDLIVANPPYVISPANEFAYRDSGEAADTLVLRLLGELPAHLTEGGFAQLLGNWVARGGSWRAPVEEAFADKGCDAVLLKYDEEEPERYARDWNRPLATRDHRAFEREVERWLAYYREHEIDSIVFGMIVLRRRNGDRNWVRALKVPAGPTEGAGEHVERLFSGWDWVREGAAGPVQLSPGARLLRRLSLDDGTERITLEVRPNAGFAARIDPEVAEALARSEELAPAEVRRLVGLGLLGPA